jgi:hypothetical protein
MTLSAPYVGLGRLAVISRKSAQADPPGDR